MKNKQPAFIPILLDFTISLRRINQKSGFWSVRRKAPPRAEKLFGGGVVYQQYYIELINATGITDTYFPIALNILP